VTLRAACRALGLTLIGTAAVLLATDLARSADAPPTAIPSPSPSPSAKPAWTHGGPIAISVTGNIAAGQQVNNGLAGSTATTTDDAGALLDLSRHTPTTSTDLQIPVLLGAQSSVSQATAEYDTPRESVLYGPQQVGALGLLPAGATTRGPALLLPRRHGDVTFYGGVVQGFPSYLVKGVRLRTIGSAGFLTIAAFDADAASGGRVDGLMAGFATRPGKLSAQIEVGFEHAEGLGTINGLTIPDGSGLALESRVDDGGAASYWSLDLRDLSPNYVELGGVSQDDRYGAVSYRTTFAGGSLTASVERDRTSSETGIDDSQQQTVSLQNPLGKSATLLTSFTDQLDDDVNSGRTWTGTATINLGATLRGTALTAGSTIERTTATVGLPLASVSYDLGLSHAFKAFTMQALASVARQTSIAGPDLATTGSVGVSSSRGKTLYSVMYEESRQFTPESALRTVGPTISVGRRLSPAITLSVNAVIQDRHDPLQPLSDGHSTQFGFSLGAPFSFGNGIVTGRADPRLPGTILGVVQSAISNSPLFATQGSATIGAANIAVVLDGTQTVRTDVQGRFAFRFVPAGVHEVTIDPASLPRGEQSANPLTTINLAGGQQAQLVLGIGAYGSIVGTITAGTTPISNVVVLLDGQGRATTDAHGIFAFGGLSGGPHTVSIVADTFPATYGGLAQPKQTVNVVVGDVAHVAFTAAALGSIGGKVVYDGAHGGNGVENAYVVAEPGEHAGITDPDGTFLLDNLPPGAYTLSVDPETLGPGLGVVSDVQIPVTLASGAHVQGLGFTVGEADKDVIFTFKGNDTNVVIGHALVKRLPPGGATEISATTSHPADRVDAQLLGVTTPLTFHPATHTWTGIVHVPLTAKAGTAAIALTSTGKVGGSGEIDLTVDPEIPIVTFLLNPRNPQKGQYVHVRAHILADVKPGDSIVWQDGTATKLPKPRSGRYYEFDVKVTEIPFHGSLVTAAGQIPVTLIH
jgi:hypothetical protein